MDDNYKTRNIKRLKEEYDRGKFHPFNPSI